MRSASSAVVVVLLLAPLAAQDMKPPEPAAELAKLKPLVGTWEGKGTVHMAPGTEPMAWTAQSAYEWTLGNHFVKCDMNIDFGGNMPTLVFREYYGWDRETKRYVFLALSNTGEAHLAELTFVAENTFATLVTKKGPEGLASERGITTITKDGMEFVMTKFGTSGPAADVVKGKFSRVEKLKPLAIEATAAMAPVPEAMAKIHRTVGTYEVAGEMTMMPGTPVMKITGTDTARSIFGGAVLYIATKGVAEHSPDPYFADNYLVWNADKGCYDAFGLDNMGWVGVMEQRFEGDTKLVATNAQVFMGQPTTNRMVVELDANGKMTRVTGYSCCGSSDPYCSFKGTYKLSK